MAELTNVHATEFIRAAVVRHLAAEHAKLFPGVASPWDAESDAVVVRRAAEVS